MFYRVVIFITFLIVFALSLNSCNKKTQSNSQDLSSNNLPKEVYFNEHIAEIIYTKCATCHRPGESGPFKL
jgi:hypothetical protein